MTAKKPSTKMLHDDVAPPPPDVVAVAPAPPPARPSVVGHELTLAVSVGEVDWGDGYTDDETSHVYSPGPGHVCFNVTAGGVTVAYVEFDQGRAVRVL